MSKNLESGRKPIKCNACKTVWLLVPVCELCHPDMAKKPKSNQKKSK